MRAEALQAELKAMRQDLSILYTLKATSAKQKTPAQCARVLRLVGLALST